MSDKDFTLALGVPVIWFGGLLTWILYTIASPVLFFVALFRPEGVDDIIALFD